MDNESRALLQAIIAGRLSDRRSIEAIAQVLLDMHPPEFVEQYKSLNRMMNEQMEAEQRNKTDWPR